MGSTFFVPETALDVVRGFAITVRTTTLILPLLASIGQSALAQSQTVVIDCLPSWQTNDRFRSETLIKHPSLSLNGFDCGSNCAIGYGLKQVLEKVYGATTEQEVVRVFKNIVNKANDSFEVDKIRLNTEILQAKGFVALAAYVLENNDYDPTTLTPALPAAAQAVENFRTALDRTSMWKMEESIDDDGVKWATPLTNVARAMDFYLALENAYAHYDLRKDSTITSTELLDQNKKTRLMDAYLDFMNDLEERKDIIANIWGISLLTRYHAEPGNASLKMQISLGYAALTYQNSQGGTPNTLYDRISRAFKAAGEEAGNTEDQRRRYWRYQSDDGKFFWTEGPYYFHLTLSQVIPFWHTARINEFLRNTDLHSYRFSDPFRYPGWFLNPLHWLADISTPDGKMPPLDDGHKHEMYNAGVLAWKGVYGNNDIGEKFARIAGRVKPSLSATLYPVEIAIPRHSLPDSGPLDGIFGNEDYNRDSGENGRQEVVVRRTMLDGKQHYILLNGESGDAILRGEGHEQPDQLQLLYYVDDTSYLVDSGYDSAWGLSNSTWNNYFDHNVMILESDSADFNTGGITSPTVSFRKRRKVSNHANVAEIYGKSHGNIDLLSGQSFLFLTSSDEYFDPVDMDTDITINIISANYYRNVLFINDSNYPYIIDINSIIRNRDNSLPSQFKMYYHGNSNDTSLLPNGSNSSTFEALRWNNIYKSRDKSSPDTTSNQLFIQPFSVEDTLYFHEQSDTIREAYISGMARGSGFDIRKMELHNTDFVSPINFTTVAFIRVLPDGIGKSNLAIKDISSSNQGSKSWPYFIWMRDNNTVDVIVSRSSEDYDDSSSSFYDFLYFPIPEADSFYVELPANLKYGFLRLTRQGGIWDVAPSFQLNLQKSLLRTSLSGPDCLVDANKGRFISRTRGGKPPYSYLWSLFRTCDGPGPRETCEVWIDGIGPDSSYIDHGRRSAWDNFKIRVQVTDSSSPQQSMTSNELDVRVISSTEGSCPVNTNSSVDAQDENVFASDTDLLEVDQDIPETYALRQNFPNPFNPSTEIRFDLPEDAMVSLVIYDVLGREVARLVQEELPAGTHRARFNAGNLPSGVYFYRIQAGDFHNTHRMTLLK